jgi:predicted permease
VLLTGAGLLVRTLNNLRNLELGFAAEHVLQVELEPESTGYTRQQLAGLFERVTARLRSVPGVVSVSMAAVGYGTGNTATCCIAIEGFPHQAGDDRQFDINGVTPGYFQTLGLPILAGRDFDPRDVRSRSTDSNAAMINETMARKYFGSDNPVGRRFGWGDPPHVKYSVEIVGVVRDARYGHLRESPKPLIYFPAANGRKLVIRTAGDLPALAATTRRAIAAIDRNLDISEISTVADSRERELSRERLLARLSGFFGLVALALAAVGIYGLVAYAAARRTQEIGLRMALGARRSQVVWFLMRRILTIVMAGAAMGTAAALWASRLVAGQLFGVSPNDPWTLGGAVGLVAVSAVLAGLLPARAASQMDPLRALRHE